jgi:hypothetical protein
MNIVQVLIIAVIMKFSALTPKSHIVILILLLVLFLLSVITLSFVIIPFFSKSSTGSFVGMFLFMAAILPAEYIDQIPLGSPARNFCLILSPSAFNVGIKILLESDFVGNGIDFNNINDPLVSSYGVTLQSVLLFLLLDTFLYLGIGWYIDYVRGDGGRRFQFNFFDVETRVMQRTNSGNLKELIKEHEKTVAKSGIQISGLAKTFQTPTGPFTALNGLNVNFYENEILALLGHNGAG